MLNNAMCHWSFIEFLIFVKLQSVPHISTVTSTFPTFSHFPLKLSSYNEWAIDFCWIYKSWFYHSPKQSFNFRSQMIVLWVKISQKKRNYYIFKLKNSDGWWLAQATRITNNYTYSSLKIKDNWLVPRQMGRLSLE